MVVTKLSAMTEKISGCDKGRTQHVESYKVVLCNREPEGSGKPIKAITTSAMARETSMKEMGKEHLNKWKGTNDGSYTHGKTRTLL